MTRDKRELVTAPWRPPTRRAFVAMLGAAAALVLVPEPATPARATSDKVRWIGHC